MGWKEGQGLGKHKEGPIEPLKLDVKIDRKGLVTQEEVSSKNKVQISINKESMPVSLFDGKFKLYLNNLIMYFQINLKIISIQLVY